MSIPPELQSSLESRIREQIAAEDRRDVAALYEFTLPEIRAKRIAERIDGAALSLSDISDIEKFVDLIHAAEIVSIEVEHFDPCVARGRFAGHPLAGVITKVRYNHRTKVDEFRTMWVHSEGTWYSTALGKTYFGEAPVV